MYEVSAKGTVPVLILKDRVIDESIEIIDWVLERYDLFKNNISKENDILTRDIINIFDNKFKHHLDRYKYSSRYEDNNSNKHREECMNILYKIEKIISADKWFFGEKVNKLDISILPFIRQFRIADNQWFDKQTKINKVKKLLSNFLESELFKDIMFNYDVWEKGKEPIYFP